MWFHDLHLAFFVFASWQSANAFVIKRQTSDLLASYDYIVAGGGTSGLTVADRLTAAFPSSSVLVVEYGQFANGTDVLKPLVPAGPSNPDYSFNIPSLPEPGLNGKTFTATVGKVVGGSSAINAQVFDRGSAADYNAWGEVAGEEFEKVGWNWDGLLPYFKKSVTFTSPSESDVEAYGYTYDIDAAYGGNGSIQASFPPFQWPSEKVYRQAWRELGAPEPKEAAAGSPVGLLWIPSSQDPKTQTRSYARTGHYDPVSSRSNYHILVGHKVTEVILDENAGADGGDYTFGARGVKIQAVGNNTTTFDALGNKEIILAAGALHTPGILQRSGVGPSDVLKAANIPVKVELPGVGQNFQDHDMAAFAYNFSSPMTSYITLLQNATLMAEAEKQYQEKKGPLTLSGGNSIAFLSLPLITNETDALLADLTSADPGSYLPNGTHPSVLEGYTHQLKSLHGLLASDKAAVFEFITGLGDLLVFLKPLSRGTVNINTTDPLAEPQINYRTLTHPLDVALHIKGGGVIRRFYQTPAGATFGPAAVSPDASVQTDEQWATWLKENVTPSLYHPIGTASLGPEDRGGVVGPDLKVHGVSALRVVDASIMPLIPGTHTSATVYAVAEKAADLIISEGK